MYLLEQGGLIMQMETTAVSFFFKVSVLRKVAHSLYEGQCSLSHCISSWKKLISIFTHINCFISLQGSEAQFRPIISNLLAVFLIPLRIAIKPSWIYSQSLERRVKKPWRWKFWVSDCSTLYLPTSRDITVGTFISIYQVSMAPIHSSPWIMN